MPRVWRSLRQPVRNTVRNSICAGAVAGTPGTPPRDWTAYLPDAGNGLNSQIVGLNYEDGMPRLDWRFWGTPSVSSNSSLIFHPSFSPVHTRIGEPWTLSAYVKLVAGPTLPFAVGIQINERDTADVFLDASVTLFTPTTGSLRQQRQIYSGVLTNVNTARIAGSITLFYVSGVAIDFTLGIALPQLQRGRVATAAERRLIV